MSVSKKSQVINLPIMASYMSHKEVFAFDFVFIKCEGVYILYFNVLVLHFANLLMVSIVGSNLKQWS